MHWKHLDGTDVQCLLCPFNCSICEGGLGRCRVRKNVGGQLYSLNYHRVCSTAVDPIEKKPLFHFQPGSTSLSIACVGCNFQCDFCQNWQLSQMPRDSGEIAGQPATPEALVSYAKRNGCKSISYTYMEPTIYYELAFETSKLAHEAGLKNVFVSNGYTSIDAYRQIEPYLDAINVDLKAFTEDFYVERCRAHLEPVLKSLRWLATSSIWVEVTTLLIPGRNDSDDELEGIAKFIAGEMGVEVPWHVSRYRPDYNYSDSPATPLASVERALKIGSRAGLRYCYGGNTMGHRSESTYCYKCGALLIERSGFSIIANTIRNGRCTYCDAVIDGVEL